MKRDNECVARYGWSRWILVIGCAAVALGCQTESQQMDMPISTYRDRMLVANQEDAAAERNLRIPRDPMARPVSAQSQLAERPALLARPAVKDQPAPADVLIEIPDPANAPTVFAQRLEKLRQDQSSQPDQRVARNFEQVVDAARDYLRMLEQPKQVKLGLADCVRRAVENNYTIRIEAHGPAISQTQIVEAEAAFDVEFFLDTAYSKQDQATFSTFTPSTSDTRSIEGGFRKLMPSGMSASVSMRTQRSSNDLPAEFQQVNPVYNTNFVASLQQPLLRGFGLDVNRSQIMLAKVDHRISEATFVQKVRDTLFDVEQAYWNLVRARRTVGILAETVAQNRVTYSNMKERLGHDATQVEVANAESRWKTQEVNFLEAIKTVHDAEDRLKNLLNDPDLKLSDELEIIPTEVPNVAPTMVDQFGSVRTALDRRSEIKQSRERIEGARINTHAAKNAILPKLDLTFQYEVQGTGVSADASFDNMTTNRFISYTVMANFAYNFGERRARAAHRRARLQESQAIVALNQATDFVVEEVNQSVRTLMVRYEQVPPALLAVKATERNLRSLQARTQQINPTFLQTELQTVEQLASTRSTLLQVITDYNVGIVQLEKVKGTLLDYNNVVVADESSR